MSIRADKDKAQENSRLVFVSLADFSLGLMHNWKDRLPDLESTAIVMAVLVIRAEKLVRLDADRSLLSLSSPVAQDKLSKCSIASIAAATGLNRETARRKVKRLVANGVLLREENGSLGFVPGRLQRPVAQEIADRQLALLVRLVNKLLRVGVLNQSSR